MEKLVHYSKKTKVIILTLVVFFVTVSCLFADYFRLSVEVHDYYIRFENIFFKNQLMGVPKTLGVSSLRLKESIEKKMIDDQYVMNVFNQVRNKFESSIVYAMDREGNVIISTSFEGNNGKVESLTGKNYQFRQYFKAAMEGHDVVYPALGATTNKRGIYYSAPIWPSNEDFKKTPLSPIGVMVMKQGMEELDKSIESLDNIKHDAKFLLLTPEGFVFSANDKNYIFKKAADGSRMASEDELKKQFGSIERTPFYLSKRSFPFFLWHEGKPYFTYEKKIILYGDVEHWSLIMIHPILNQFLFVTWFFSLILFIGLFKLYCLFRHSKIDKINALRMNEEQGQLIYGQQNLIESIFESLSYPFYVVSVSDKKLIMENIKSKNSQWYFNNKGTLIPIQDVIHARRSLIQEKMIGDHYYEIHAYPIYNKNGEVDKVIEYAQDITERKMIEKEKDHVMKQLYQSTKLASIGELAAGVAHEINNPLAIIKGYIDIVSKTLEKGNLQNPIIEDSILKIKDSVNRIAKIVLGLRTYARVDVENEAKKIDVLSVILQTISLIEIVFNKSNVKFKIEKSPNIEKGEAPLIMATDGKMQQVFMNLFSNAKDAISEREPGGGLNAENQEGLIEVKCELNENNVRIYVKDNGVGMKKEIQSRIFETFFTTKPVGKGTGLGMSISQSIVDSFNGKMSFESVEGEGTTMILDFPRAK